MDYRGKKAKMKKFKVTKKAMRPASSQEACFYCQQLIGEFHKEDCVLISKKALIRVIVEYEVEIPAHWGKKETEFHRNDGTSCADNTIDELQELATKEGCLCGIMKHKYIKDTSKPFLSEE
jgi:hypothetical protein